MPELPPIIPHPLLIIPRRFTGNIVPDGKSRFTVQLPGLGALTYALDGWLEYTREQEGAVLRVVNLTGTAGGDRPELAPGSIHLRLAPGTTVGVEGAAELVVEYPELGAVASRAIETSGDLAGAVRPLVSSCQATLQMNAQTNGFVLTAAGKLPGFPSVVEDERELDFDTYIECGDGEAGAKCIEICISVKIRKTDSNKTLQTDAQLKELMEKLNKIWKCPGQCCIKFKLQKQADGSGFVSATDLPYSIDTKDDKEHLSDELYDVTKSHPNSDGCWNIYFINLVKSGFGGSGVTDLKRHGSVIGLGMSKSGGVVDCSLDDLSEVLAHELGHAVGLANGETFDNSGNLATDPDGVTNHSTHHDNVMGIGPGRTKLNAKQCDTARQSELAKKGNRAADCSDKPSEI